MPGKNNKAKSRYYYELRHKKNTPKEGKKMFANDNPNRRRNSFFSGCGCLLVSAACLTLVAFLIWNPFNWFQKTEIAPQPTTLIPATPSAFSENPTIEPLQPKDWFDSTNYPQIFKGELDGVFYCGARAASASYPAGFKLIESWEKVPGDGNYLHASTGNEYSMYSFCAGDSPEKHFAPQGTKWITVLLEVSGLVEVTFPLR